MRKTIQVMSELLKLNFGGAMKLAACLAILGAFASAQSDAGPTHATKHNMVLVGENEVFASHIVYKVPHNYQVILEVRLPAEAKRDYLAAKASHPNDTMILLLDAFDISQIASRDSLSGTILREDVEGARETVRADVRLQKDEFKLLFFDELPLSLESGHAHAHGPADSPEPSFTPTPAPSPSCPQTSCPTPCPPHYKCVNGKCEYQLF